MRPNTDEVLDRIIAFYSGEIIPMAKGNVDAAFAGLGLMLFKGYYSSEAKNFYESNNEIRKALQYAKEQLKEAGFEHILPAKLEGSILKEKSFHDEFPTIDQLRKDHEQLNALLEELITAIYSIDNPIQAIDVIHADLRSAMKKLVEREFAATAPILAQVMNSLP